MSRNLKALRNILIVEDDTTQISRYLEMAKAAGFEGYGASTLKGAIDALRSKSFQFLLTDIHLNPGRQDTFEGLQILAEAKANHPEVIRLAMSSDPKIETYDKVMDSGAVYLFRKPILTKDELLIHLELAEKGRRSVAATSQKSGFIRNLPAHLLRRCPDGVVVSDAIRDRIRKALNSPLPILLFGETGTGKEEVAKIIRRMHSEKYGPVPFVAVNCANLSGETAVSAIFGHKKGAFTGADSTTNGYIGEANGGFLFLDEIHTLSLDVQHRLLRVFNDGTYQRLGDSQTLHSDFRVIVASSKDLDDQVEAGTFLLDLATRLTGIKIKLLPLRERFEDLPLLIELALARVGAEVSKETLTELVERCKGYYWQGNLRQLFQVISVLATEAFGDEKEIVAADLPEFKTMLPPGGALKPKVALTVSGDWAEVVQSALEKDILLDTVVEAVEKAVLEKAFKRHVSLRAVSEALGVSRSTLSIKKTKYGIEEGPG